MRLVANLGAARPRVLSLLLLGHRRWLRGIARVLLTALKAQHQLDQIFLARALQITPVLTPEIQTFYVVARPEIQGVSNFQFVALWPKPCCRRFIAACCVLPSREKIGSENPMPRARTRRPPGLEAPAAGNAIDGGQAGPRSAQRTLRTGPNAGGAKAGSAGRKDAGEDACYPGEELSCRPACCDRRRSRNTRPTPRR